MFPVSVCKTDCMIRDLETSNEKLGLCELLEIGMALVVIFVKKSGKKNKKKSEIGEKWQCSM